MQGAAQGATQNYYDVIKAAQSGASKAGRYGSGVSADIQNRAANTLANTLTNKYGEFLQLIADTVLGIIGNTPRNVIPIIYRRQIAPSLFV